MFVNNGPALAGTLMMDPDVDQEQCLAPMRSLPWCADFIPPTTMALMMIPLAYLGIGAVSALGAGVGTALGFATGLQIRRWLPKSPPGEQHSTATVPLVHA